MNYVIVYTGEDSMESVVEAVESLGFKLITRLETIKIMLVSSLKSIEEVREILPSPLYIVTKEKEIKLKETKKKKK